MKRQLFIWLIMIYTTQTYAQNNPIFGGGVADGWNNGNFQQAASAIFKGGEGDGWQFGTFLQPVSNIFNGGEGDGWNTGNFAQTANAIFNGGEGDGWDYTTYLQAGNDIFKGGEGDGWDFTTYLQAGNSIFSGGEGDGWSSTYRPMGPLPVTYLYFNAGKLNVSAALLKWETSRETNSALYEVERSQDALLFSKIGTVTAAGNSSAGQFYSFTDFQPQPGLNYYRLKQVDKDGGFTYSPARVVRFGENLGAGVKYYPNPTNGILNIELDEQLVKESKIVNISTATGIMVTQWKLAANGQNVLQVDLSRFAKGIYFIQVKTSNFNSVHRIVLQ